VALNFLLCPPIASGYRGSRKNTTIKEYVPPTNQLENRNAPRKINSNIGRTACVATNLKSYFVSIDPDYMRKDPNGYQGQELHGQRRESAHNCHSHQGSWWADSKAACSFCAQSTQFDTGMKSFRKCTHPSASQLISVIHMENYTSQLCNNRSNLAASAYQIAQHEQSTHLQISQQIGDFLQMQDYGQAPSAKLNNCI
jgi:hypothetical protein